MSARRLVLLSLAAAAAVLLAWFAQREVTVPPPAAGGRLLPELDAGVNEIEALALEPADGEPFRIERAGDGWIVPSQHDYPADAGKLRRFVLQLADARVVEEKSAKPESWASMGVQDVDAEGAEGVKIRLEGLDPAPELVIGKRAARGGEGSYVRRADAGPALLVDQALAPATTPLDWLDREILDVDAAEVTAITITPPDGEALVLERDPAGGLAVRDLPEGGRLAAATAPDTLARALAGLSFEAVRPAADWPPAAEPFVAEFRLRDGRLITARNAELDEGTWTRFAVTLAPPDGDEAEADGADAEGEADEGDESEASAAIEPASVEDVAAQDARLNGWLFRLPDWKRELLTRRLGDLLAEPAD